MLQVVISFTVEAFVLQLELSNKRKRSHNKKICERNVSLYDPDSVEGKDTDTIEPLVLPVYIHEMANGKPLNDIMLSN